SLKSPESEVIWCHGGDPYHEQIWLKPARYAPSGGVAMPAFGDPFEEHTVRLAHHFLRGWQRPLSPTPFLMARPSLLQRAALAERHAGPHVYRQVQEAPQAWPPAAQYARRRPALTRGVLSTENDEIRRYHEHGKTPFRAELH